MYAHSIVKHGLVFGLLTFSTSTLAEISALNYKADSGDFDLNFYGKLNTTLQNNRLRKNGSTDKLKSEIDLQGNSSRFGLKGGYDFNPDFSIIYQVEYGFNFNTDGQSGKRDLTQRNTYLGIDSAYGTIKGGLLDTPLKSTSKQVDLFNDNNADIGSLVRGENRLDNSFYYTSPRWNGVGVELSRIINKGADNEKGLSTSINYNKDGLYAAFAFDNSVGGRDIRRVVSAYTINDLTLGFLWQEGEDLSNDDKEDGYLISLKYQVELTTFKFQYSNSEERFANGKSTSIGFDRKIDQASKWYVFYTNQNGDGSGNDGRFTALGYEIKF